ncbi:amino-acid N-acetyltransferase [Pseudoxanthomonas sp. GM95]|uniref:arsenic resistance N-acetyltransferase ArsN2 n=1 Tax=Pseudoxanthomonas sp. GM95 TaxID=1881043 RepID=UPI0008CCFE45|nr:arsenic resistance N-acetyltransferase ArsN2 [Pseudoxanthomonas sp. GM95]SEL13295.1 amino-acid N-acetyltransferase [Pseudoxanthomonas sp. GM95]
MNIISPIALDRRVLDLLVASGLPIEDLEDDVPRLYAGAEEEGRLIGVVAIEMHGNVGLLRSLSVRPDARGMGLSLALIDAGERLAAEAGIAKLFLLTTTAAPLFERCGYALTPRANAPDAIRSTRQFSGMCPSSASFMSKTI